MDDSEDEVMFSDEEGDEQPYMEKVSVRMRVRMNMEVQ